MNKKLNREQLKENQATEAKIAAFLNEIKYDESFKNELEQKLQEKSENIQFKPRFSMLRFAFTYLSGVGLLLSAFAAIFIFNPFGLQTYIAELFTHPQPVKDQERLVVAEDSSQLPSLQLSNSVTYIEPAKRDITLKTGEYGCSVNGEDITILLTYPDFVNVIDMDGGTCDIAFEYLGATMTLRELSSDEYLGINEQYSVGVIDNYELIRIETSEHAYSYATAISGAQCTQLGYSAQCASLVHPGFASDIELSFIVSCEEDICDDTNDILDVFDQIALSVKEKPEESNIQSNGCSGYGSMSIDPSDVAVGEEYTVNGELITVFSEQVFIQYSNGTVVPISVENNSENSNWQYSGEFTENGQYVLTVMTGETPVCAQEGSPLSITITVGE